MHALFPPAWGTLLAVRGSSNWVMVIPKSKDILKANNGISVSSVSDRCHRGTVKYRRSTWIKASRKEHIGQFERYRKASEAKGIRVSWERYHLAVLFVDRTDTTRAKVAAGLFDRIGNWNGFGRALYPSTAGVEATGATAEFTTSAGLMSQAGRLKIPAKMFTRPSQQFELEDFDRNDILLAVDVETRRQLTEILCEGVPDCKETMAKVALLTDFKDYLAPDVLLRGGGSAVLEPELKQILEPAIERAQRSEGIRSPNLTGGSEEWNEMVQDTICSCAGLTQFLIDAWPPDLPEYDPV